MLNLPKTTNGDEADDVGKITDEEHDDQTETQENQGRPVRDQKAPTWLKDYVTAYGCISEEHKPSSY